MSDADSDGDSFVVRTIRLSHRAMFLSARRTIGAKGRLDGIIGGARWLYGLLMGGTFLFSVVIPALLICLGADRHVVANSFPEEIGNMPVVVFGWLPASVFTVFVRKTYDIPKAAREKKPRQPPTLC